MVSGIPREVLEVVGKLEKAGFDAYVVGGCVRDLLLGREPEDWDVTTSAKPEEIQKIFPENFYENKFFTVTVQTQSENPKLKGIEVTTYRSDHKYTDRRRPEEVKYAKTIDEDLSRRDFTVNAIALGFHEARSMKHETAKEEGFMLQASGFMIVDPFEGQKDLKRKIIRAVGNPEERFAEDALRMMRAARLATVLNFTIEEKTRKAIQEKSALLKEISKERVRDELVKIIMAARAREGIELLYELKLLQYSMPELEEGYGVQQNKHHKYTVWEHNLFSLEYAAKQQWNLAVRVAALLHDVAKPRVKEGEGSDATFYNHEVIGEKMSAQVLSRLKYGNDFVEKVAKLVRYHLFYYNVGEVTEAGVRRFVRRAGLEYIDDLLRLREADRIGSGVPKAFPYKLRHLLYMIEKVRRDPLSVKALAVDGEAVMKTVGLVPGPRVGWILNALMEEVLDAPEKNTEELLTKRMKALAKLSDEELQEKGEKGKRQMEEFERGVEAEIKGKYRVG